MDMSSEFFDDSEFNDLENTDLIDDPHSFTNYEALEDFSESEELVEDPVTNIESEVVESVAIDYENVSNNAQNAEETVTDPEDVVEFNNPEILGKGVAGIFDTVHHSERLVQLPLARIKSIMKLDPDISLMSQESIFLITKATELFIDSLAKEAFNNTVKTKKKTVQKKDLDQAIEAIDALAFLEGALNF